VSHPVHTNRTVTDPSSTDRSLEAPASPDRGFFCLGPTEFRSNRELLTPIQARL
jgi:hypothetical protein